MWNGPKNGTDWSTVDFTKPGWVNGVMELTHEEVVHVLTETQRIIDEFNPDNEFSNPSDEYVVPEYNKSDWEKCINGDTYNIIKQYDPEVNTQGIDANGIIGLEPFVEEEPQEGDL